MWEFITRYWIQVLFSGIVAFFGWVYRYLRKGYKTINEQQNEKITRIQEESLVFREEIKAMRLKAAEEQNLVSDILYSLLRDRLLQCCRHHISKGYCDILEKDILNEMFQQYQKLGGNGTIEGLIKEIRKLPSKKQGGDKVG